MLNVYAGIQCHLDIGVYMKCAQFCWHETVGK